MRHGFIKVAAITPDVKVGDIEFNTKSIITNILTASKKGVDIAVLPELAITGYTCGDLFNQRLLIKSSLNSIANIKNKTKDINIISIVGFPFEHLSKLYNCAAVIYKGSVLAVIPKSYLPNYNEFYEKRWFVKGNRQAELIDFLDSTIPFGTDIIIKSNQMEELCLAVEICEDLWSVIPPSSRHSLAGATIIANPSASNEITGKDVYRKSLVEGQSARAICGYVYACAGNGESTTDVVFPAHNIISENGYIISEGERFQNNIIYSDIDVYKLSSERQKNTTFITDNTNYKTVKIDFKPNDSDIERYIDPHPFVPANIDLREKRCKEILDIQALSLKKRIEQIGCKNVVIGISGGLDSTQALIVAVKAFDLLKLDTKGIISVTMPALGTTSRTHNNAIKLANKLNTTLLEIDITDSVLRHFKDIGHDKDIKDVTYENVQARLRTMMLMNIASKHNAFVLGTGDLSELALGFATYNGDHMSMYGINCSIPKTLIKYLIAYTMDSTKDKELSTILEDILATPVSPELLPPDENGDISQVTEDVVGPYELHDFFLYNMMRLGFEPRKVYYLCTKAYNNKYDNKTIYKWLKSFYFRFFTQQFKRSCLPDGPKVGSVSLSPRGDWKMPSDAVVKAWLNDLEAIAES